MPHVAVIEDEPTIRMALVDALGFAGHEVSVYEDGLAGLEGVRANTPDVVLLDIMLPRLDGVEVLRQLRAGGSRVPIMMLTAKGAEADRVRGLENGADDYLVKPFSVKEMLARVEALLRRSDWRPAAPPVVTAGRVRIDLARGEAVVDGRQLELTPREVDILRYLMARPQRVISKREFLLEVWGYPDVPIETRTVENTITTLRRKIEQGEPAPSIIETVRGKGFKLGPDVTWEGTEA